MVSVEVRDPGVKTGDVIGVHRWQWIVLAGLVGLQLLGYLLVWLVLHDSGGSQKGSVSSEVLVSTGWYYPGSAYAMWFAKLPLLSAIVRAHAAQRVLLGLGFAFASAGYCASLLLVRRWALQIGTAWLVAAMLAIALPLVLLPQIPTTDVWCYIMHGRVAVLHGGNPFVDPPSAYPDDPFLPRVYWKMIPSVYGPVWVATSILLTRVARLLGGSPGTYLLTFKGFLLACHLANVLLVRRILRMIRPGRQTLGAILYAWNPLVLFEFAGGAHNDCFMLTLLLAGIALAAAGRTAGAVGGLMAAGLVKLPGLLVLPAYSHYAARRSGRPVVAIACHVLIAMAVAALFYTPFWRGADTFRATANAPNLQLMYHSPAAAVSKILESTFSGGTKPKEWRQGKPPAGSLPARVRAAVRRGSLLCFFLCLAALTFRRILDFDGWLDRMIWIYVAYLLFAAFCFNPWYGTWLVPLAALMRKPSPLIVVSSIMFLVLYLPLEIAGAATFCFWPLFLLVLLQIQRSVRQAMFVRQRIVTRAPQSFGAEPRPPEAACRWTA